MEMYTDGYLEFVLEAIEEARQDCPDPKVLIEQRLDFSCYVPDGFGTGDCLIVADKLLHIIDLKYGQGVLVNAEENPQMMLYALGALRIFDCLYDIETVSMTIYQPRRENVSTWVISVAELRDWAEKTLKPKAELAFKGEGEYCPGSWCQFCKAAVKCRARADAKLQLAKYEFAQPPLLSDAEIGDILGKLDDLTKWANELMAYAQEAAVNHGKQWPGVTGKLKWTNNGKEKSPTKYSLLSIMLVNIILERRKGNGEGKNVQRNTSLQANRIYNQEVCSSNRNRQKDSPKVLEYERRRIFKISGREP